MAKRVKVLVKVYVSRSIHRRLRIMAAIRQEQIGRLVEKILDSALPECKEQLSVKDMTAKATSDLTSDEVIKTLRPAWDKRS